MELNLTKAMDINSIASHLYLLPNKVQFCHHLTVSYASHMAMNGLYDAIDGLKDELIEKIIGYTGIKFSQISLGNISGFKEANCLSVAYEVMNYGKELEAFAEKQGWCDVANVASTYSGAGAKAVYLLKLS